MTEECRRKNLHFAQSFYICNGLIEPNPVLHCFFPLACTQMLILYISSSQQTLDAKVKTHCDYVPVFTFFDPGFMCSQTAVFIKTAANIQLVVEHDENKGLQSLIAFLAPRHTVHSKFQDYLLALLHTYLFRIRYTFLVLNSVFLLDC